MNGKNGFRDLRAWQLGVDVAVALVPLATRLQNERQFELSRQLTRAAFSVPLNIAEGYGLDTRPNFCRHVRIARGSLGELQTLLHILERADLTYGMIPDSLDEKLEELGRVSYGLAKHLENKTHTQRST